MKKKESRGGKSPTRRSEKEEAREGSEEKYSFGPTKEKQPSLETNEFKLGTEIPQCPILGGVHLDV